MAKKHATGGWFACDNAVVLTGLEPGSTIRIRLQVKTNKDVSAGSVFLHSYPTAVGDNNHYKVGGVIRQVELGNCVNEWQTIEMEIIVPDDGNVYLGGSLMSEEHHPGEFELYMKDVQII